MISDKNKLVQVMISKTAYQYIKKYCEVFGGTLFQFCADAINRKILIKEDLINECEKK